MKIIIAGFMVLLNVLLFRVNEVKAQDITMEETLSYINGKFGSICQLDVLRGVLIARYFEGSEVFREDQVLCKSLNLSSMNYDKELRMFTVDCSGTTKCVDRQLFVRKIQRDYNRISFPVTLDARAEAGMKKAFTHMISLVLDPKYKSSDPFE